MKIKEVHDSWKQKGFPYYPKDKKWRDNIFNQLINFKRDTLVDRRNKVIGQAAHGLNLHGLIWNTHGVVSVAR